MKIANNTSREGYGPLTGARVWSGERQECGEGEKHGRVAYKTTQWCFLLFLGRLRSAALVAH